MMWAVLLYKIYSTTNSVHVNNILLCDISLVLTTFSAFCHALIPPDKHKEKTI